MTDQTPDTIRALADRLERRADIEDVGTEETDAAYEDVPEVTWEEMREIVGLLREAASTLRALADQGQYAEGWHRAVETICTIVGVSPALSSDESVVAVRERVEAIRQETARATWERAAQIADASQLVGRPRNRGEDCWNRAARLIARTLRDQLPVLQVAATPPEDQR